MIIAIDGYEANVPTRVGIGRYAYELLVHIYEETKKRRSEDAKGAALSFIIYLPSAPLPDMPKETEWWQYRVVGPKKLWTFIGLPLALLLAHPQPDVVFSPTHYIPRFILIPRVMAIMDLSYLTYPELFKKKDLHQLTHWTAYSARHAKGVFTISEFSRRAIIEAYGVDPSRVFVTYPGFSMDKATVIGTQAELAAKYDLANDYILSVGTLQPRKNFVRLIESFARYIKTSKKNMDLVIVGKKGWLYEEIVAAPATYGVSDRVKFLDFIPDSDLPGLYTHATCFVLPSLYEGFGLPVLEAMHYGCPVVVSDVSSLPEIAGAAGVYVNPEDATDIARGMGVAISEKNKPAGKKRIAIGTKQVGKFTWEKAAAQTLAVLADVGRGS